MAAEVVTADGEVLPGFPEAHLERRFVIQRDGKDFVLYAGLLDLLHKVSEGYFAIETRLEQVPTQDNGNVAICSARVQVFDPDQPDVVRRLSTGLGDASPGNVSRLMAAHLIRMAETRAKARALRDAVNVGMAAAEELAGDEPAPARQAAQEARPASFGGPVGPRPVSPAAPAEDVIALDGRRYTRAQVVARKHHWIAAAQDAKLFVPPMGAKGGPPPDDAPLPDQVDWGMETKHRLEVRAGGASGK